MAHNPQGNPQNFPLKFIVGGISSAISISLLAPLDRVKILLQTQYANPHIFKDKRFKGIIDTFRRIPSEEGYAAFWRGNFPSIIIYFPAQASRFVFKDKFKTLFGRYDSKTDFWKFFMTSLASGAAAGAAGLLFTYPFDFARTRLAADVGRSVIDRQFTGMTDCLTKVLKSDGIIGVYRGFSITIWGVIAYRALYFGLYDALKKLVAKDNQKISLLTSFMVAQGVTLSSGVLTYPFDTVRRRLMMQSGLQKKMYNGTVDCFRKIYQMEGGRGFFNGILINLFKTTSGALSLIAYDMIRH